METWQVALVVGIVFVVPQAVGLAAARIGKHRSAAAWPLAAVGVVGLLWAAAAISEHVTAGSTKRDCGGAGDFWFFALAVMVLHFVVGSILGVLDQRARARAGE